MIDTNGKDYIVMEQAIEFLDYAIEFFYEKKYSAVVALAGEAEEDLGKMLDDQRKANILQKGQDLILKDGIDKKQYNFIMNRTKNWLKHAEVDHKFTPVLHCDMELEAIQYIIRAVSNYLDIKGGIRETHKKFFRYLIEYRKDYKEEFEDKKIDFEGFLIVN